MIEALRHVWSLVGGVGRVWVCVRVMKAVCCWVELGGVWFGGLLIWVGEWCIGLRWVGWLGWVRSSCWVGSGWVGWGWVELCWVWLVGWGCIGFQLCWIGLGAGWVGFSRIGLVGLYWIEVSWNEVNLIWLDKIELEWVKLVGSGWLCEV